VAENVVYNELKEIEFIQNSFRVLVNARANENFLPSFVNLVRTAPNLQKLSFTADKIAANDEVWELIGSLTHLKVLKIGRIEIRDNFEINEQFVHMLKSVNEIADLILEFYVQSEEKVDYLFDMFNNVLDKNESIVWKFLV
jgi:hypothetical protein